MGKQNSESQWNLGLAVAVVLLGVAGAAILSKPSVPSSMHSHQPTLSLEQITQKFEPLRQQYMHLRDPGMGVRGEFPGLPGAGAGAGVPGVEKLIERTRKMVAKYPEFAPGQLFLGQLYFDHSDLQKAQQYIRKSLALDPKQAQVYLLAGNIALMQRDPKAAADYLSQAIVLQPSNAQYWLYLGQSYFAQQLWAQAQQCFEQTIKLDSARTLAYSGLSDCQVQQGNLKGAVFTLQRAIDQTPISQRKQQVVFLRKQAKLLSELGKPGEALLVMRKLTNVEQADPAVLRETATYWNELGEPGKAAKLYEDQLKLYLRDWQLAAEAARWRMRAGDLAKAQQHILYLQLLNPDLPVIEQLEKELKACE